MPRAGCFAIAALATDLSDGSASCSGIGPSAFAIRTALDAATDAGANMTAGTIHQYFGAQPSAVPAF